jgi:RNA recognition motif-containing protein
MSGTKLYIGNLPYDATEEELTQLFSSKGELKSVNIVRDRYTQRSRGFGFVEYSTSEHAGRARAELNGTPLKGRPLRVDSAQDNKREPRPPR